MADRSEIYPLALITPSRTMSDKTQLNLRESAPNAHAALTALPEAIVIVDRQGVISFLNPAAQSLLCQQHSNPVGRPLHTIMLLQDEDSRTTWDPVRACFKSGEKVERDDLVLSRDTRSENKPVGVSAVPLNDSADSGAMLHIRDTSALKALSDVAHLDPLTGLPNRNLFLDRLGQAMVQANRDERLVAVLFLDLDNFKGVNDTYGHEAGDILLKAVADRLLGCVRSCDSVGRYAGDEFTLLLANLHQVQDAVRVVNKVQNELAKPVNIKSAEIPVNASIGLSIYPTDGDREDNLLRAADGAMYHAKQQGKNCARFFAAEYNRMLPDHAMDEDQLRYAFDEGQFQMHFQPRWDTRSNSLVALEALLRWKHPKRGVVPASEFLRRIEQTGFIRPLGNWALEQACEHARQWRERGLPTVPINVNLSAYQFRQQDLAALVGDAIERFEMPAGSLVLDISEATLHNNMTLMVPILHRLKGLGAELCISNFGSGCFCWRDLKQLPHHSLQLGHDLIQGVTTDNTDAATAHAVLTLAADSNRSISAAGVETAQQQAFLQQQDCHRMQGWLFNRPLPANQIIPLLAKHAHTGSDTATASHDDQITI